MATAVCDTKPCDRMQVLMKKAEMYRVTGQTTLMLTVADSHGHGTRVEFRYCPFCGTRIVLGVLNRVPER